jgi:hypothetical protein
MGDLHRRTLKLPKEEIADDPTACHSTTLLPPLAAGDTQRADVSWCLPDLPRRAQFPKYGGRRTETSGRHPEGLFQDALGGLARITILDELLEAL